MACLRTECFEFLYFTKCNRHLEDLCKTTSAKYTFSYILFELLCVSIIVIPLVIVDKIKELLQKVRFELRESEEVV